MAASRSSLREAAPLAVLALALAAGPFVWRGAVARWGPASDHIVASYLPSLEPSRERSAFDDGPLEGLTDMRPGYVIIGDSMAGRVDPDELTALAKDSIAPVLQNATGSAYWYLAFKNYVVASGITPKRVFVFFRDTNLTDPMFRLDGAYRFHLDEVARDAEPELDRVVAAHLSGSWARTHQWLDRVYGIERARSWIEPLITKWPASVVGGRDGTADALSRANQTFALERLRVMTAADLAAEEAADTNFASNIRTSVLPLFLSLAREHRLRLCFVRVLRRPEGALPPPESAAMRRYVQDLRAYLTAGGADLLDDRDEPALAQLPYADGDHIARSAREPYTDLFWKRVQRLP